MDERGQASVETVAVLPLLVLVVAAVWQAVLAGQALWLAGSAARAGARAAAVGGAPAAAVRSVLPPRLERGMRVLRSADGTVAVRVRVPVVAGRGSLGVVTARARFAG